MFGIQKAYFGLRVYICICMSICTYVCVHEFNTVMFRIQKADFGLHVYIRICVYIYMYMICTRLCICAYKGIHVCIYAHTRMLYCNVYTYLCASMVCVYRNLCMYVCMHINMYVYMHIFVCVCVFMCPMCPEGVSYCHSHNN